MVDVHIITTSQPSVKQKELLIRAFLELSGAYFSVHSEFQVMTISISYDPKFDVYPQINFIVQQLKNTNVLDEDTTLVEIDQSNFDYQGNMGDITEVKASCSV